MILGEESSRTYKLNNSTKVKIKSVMKADKVFTHKVVVEKELVTTEPLQFPNKNAVAELVEGFDLEQDQTSLMG